MWLAWVMILVLWIVFFIHYGTTRRQLEEMRSRIEELTDSLQ